VVDAKNPTLVGSIALPTGLVVAVVVLVVVENASSWFSRLLVVDVDTTAPAGRCELLIDPVLPTFFVSSSQRW
jgi:hypothetical protein